MKPTSLFHAGKYSNDWTKDFYDRAAIWWGPDPQAAGVHITRAKTIERLCGAGTKRVLDLGAGPGATAATLADLGHTVVARCRHRGTPGTVERRARLGRDVPALSL